VQAKKRDQSQEMNVTYDGVTKPAEVLSELDIKLGPEIVVNPPEASRKYSTFHPTVGGINHC
jgi:hypothetical protein